VNYVSVHLLAVYTLFLIVFYEHNNKRIDFSLREIKLFDRSQKEAMECQIDLMEKEILYFKGKKRAKAKKAYYRLLQSCGRTCGLNEPIYLIRS